MWRDEHQNPGCLSMPLFNQRKRSRLPLTSNPSESELYTASPYRKTQSSSSSSSALLNQRGQRNQQAFLSSHQTSMRATPSPGVAGRGYTPLPHPKKPSYVWSQTGQQRPPVRQEPMDAVGTQVHGGSSVSLFQPRWSSATQNQQSFHRPTNAIRMPYSHQQCTSTAGSTHGPRAPNNSQMWNFRPMGHSTSAMWTKEKMDTSSVKTTPQKPPNETSLYIITAVIEGMKHWSQYKDRVPILFEIFATLDSAVTTGTNGAKKFLIRNDKDAVQCLYYENDQTLPRLIRGQVHRCVGKYDRHNDTMTCMSVRAASLSEQRNAQDAVRVSDAEMKNVVLALSEI